MLAQRERNPDESAFVEMRKKWWEENKEKYLK